MLTKATSNEVVNFKLAWLQTFIKKQPFFFCPFLKKVKTGYGELQYSRKLFFALQAF